MKKRLVILIIFFALFTTASLGQHAITQVTYPDDIVKTIVREYTYPATISYVETKTRHYFTYADQSMTVINCEINPDIFVRDFVIMEKEVFFCGIRNGNPTIGIWGHFNIMNLVSKNLSYEIYENFACGKQIVDTLHRLVAYVENGTKHIVTVGTTTDGSATNGCTIDITPNPNSNPAWTYTIGVTPDANKERINRICVTDNLVVTSGPSANLADIGYRIHNKNNIFTPGGPQDEIWYFVISNNHPYSHYTENHEITHIGNDIVGMAIQTTELNPPDYNYPGVIVMAYDMTTLSNGTFTTLYQHYKQTPALLNIKGLKYDARTDKMILLLYGNVPTAPLYGSGSIVAEIPLLPLNITINSLSGHKLTSLDLYNFNNNFLCQGLDISQPNVSSYFTQPIGTTGFCSSNLNDQTQWFEFMTKGHLLPYTLCTKDFDCTQIHQIHTFTLPNDLICFGRRNNN